MRNMRLDEIRSATGARWAGVPGPDSAVVFGVSTDTRGISRGDLFVALRGERFDGHKFLDAAREAGATAALVNEDWAEIPAGLPCIAVPDTLTAFGALARHHRRTLPNLEVVAVAGSNGKTTTREMTTTVLTARAPVLRNEKNHNNLIGVPQTLLRLGAQHRYAVVEIGTNQPGEVARLSKVVEPDIAILTSIGEEHLEGLGSIEGVIEEESAVLAALGSRGVAIINFDDTNCLRAREKARCRVVSFGFDDRCELWADSIVGTPQGTEFRVNNRYRFKLASFGRHNVSNALAAIATGWVCGLSFPDMQSALETFKPVAMRMQAGMAGEVFIFNDAYNANPASMQAGLRTLNDFRSRGRRVAVLGDMLELGAHTQRAHEALGWFATTQQLDLLVCVGPNMRLAGREAASRGLRVVYFDTSAAAALFVADEVKARDTVLVKGSRGIAMERVVEAIYAKAGAALEAGH